MALKEKTIEEKFIKLSPREHVLKRPDTYVGSCIPQETETWVVDEKSEIRKKTISYIPAFLKIFDEIITNCSDHAHRPGTKVKNIKIEFQDDLSYFNILNDGESIPVKMHKGENVYVPEMIFGHLMTGTNYDDDEVREGAGRNGLGSKLTNIFSKEFVIDLCDGKKHYYQTFTDNLTVINEPVIKDQKGSYTRIEYYPDLTIFKMNKQVIKDTASLFRKRVYDLAVYNPNVKVFLNNEEIKINNIKDWAKLHLDDEAEFFEEKINDKWSIVLAQSPTDTFEQCSVVNGNTTWLGGSHVDYIMNQLVKELTARLSKGNKGIKIKPTDIKNKFHLFLVSTIGNPIFDSQTKETLKMKIDDSFELSDKLYKNLMKSEIIKSILEWVAMKEQAELNKMNKKAAGKTIRVEKLVDAHKAGTADSKKCALCIAEGDCVEENTLTKVFRDGDYLKIPLNKVVIGDYVLTHNNNLQEVIGTVKKVKECKSIKYSNTEIIISNEHKMLVYDKINKSFDFIKTSDLDKNKHQLVKNKSYNLESLMSVSSIEDNNDPKYKYKISLSNGHSFVSSAEHSFMVFNLEEGNIRKKRISDFKIGELIVGIEN